jgi:hypothetical protein
MSAHTTGRVGVSDLVLLAAARGEQEVTWFGAAYDEATGGRLIGTGLLRAEIGQAPRSGDPTYALSRQVKEPYARAPRWDRIVETTEIKRLDLWAKLDNRHQELHGPTIARATRSLDVVGARALQLQRFMNTLTQRASLRDAYEVEEFATDAWRAASRARDDRSAQRSLMASLPSDLLRALQPRHGDLELVADTARAARIDAGLTRSLEAITHGPPSVRDRSPAISR